MNLININNVELNFPQDENGNFFVPIKPICEAMGIDHSGQMKVIKEHSILSSTVEEKPTVGADNKQREMSCLPLKYALSWILGIDARKVKPETAEVLLRYQNACYDAIYDAFFLEPQRQKEKLIALSKQELVISELKNKRSELNEEIKTAQSELIDIKNSNFSQLLLPI